MKNQKPKTKNEKPKTKNEKRKTKNEKNEIMHTCKNNNIFISSVFIGRTVWKGGAVVERIMCRAQATL
jgi:hypothetical protein